MKVVATMLVGRLDEPFLTPALDSVSQLVDHVIVQDNGMSDENISRMLASTCYEKTTVLKHPFVDFSTNRNLACGMARDMGADWILRIDADEVHRAEQVPGIREVLEHATESCIVGGMYHHMITPWHIQDDQRDLTLFHRPYVSWGGDVHEGLQCQSTRRVDYFIHHYGYVRPPERVYESWMLYESIGGDRQEGYSPAVQWELSLCKGEIKNLLVGRKPLVKKCPVSLPEQMVKFLTPEMEEGFLRRYEELP